MRPVCRLKVAGAPALEISSGLPLLMILLSFGQAAGAQQPAPPGVALREFAARRHPQPVRVGDLLNRVVLQPLESRPVLGHVREVIRRTDGTLALVVEFGGFLGFGARPIAVPAEGMVLLGSELEVLDFSPAQLHEFPTFDGRAATSLAADDVILMGLAHPSH